MLFAYLQQLDPLKDKVPWSALWSTVFAGLPVLVLFWLLVPRRWLAPQGRRRRRGGSHLRRHPDLWHAGAAIPAYLLFFGLNPFQIVLFW